MEIRAFLWLSRDWNLHVHVSDGNIIPKQSGHNRKFMLENHKLLSFTIYSKKNSDFLSQHHSIFCGVICLVQDEITDVGYIFTVILIKAKDLILG